MKKSTTKNPRRIDNKEKGRIALLKLHKREAKSLRLLHWRGDKYLHALDMMINKTEEVASTNAGGCPPCVSFPYYDFNFGDKFEDVVLFVTFLDELRKAGCFKSYDTRPEELETYYMFNEVSHDNLINYKGGYRRRNEMSPHSYFGFVDKSFWFKLINGDSAKIDFHPRKNEGSDTLYFMHALVRELENYGENDTGRVKVMCNRDRMLEFIKKEYKDPFGVDPYSWFKTTKGNIIKKIPEGYQQLIKIGGYDRNQGGYPFSIKLPL